MRVAIASDHGGFIQKAPLASYIEGLGHEVVDFGCDSEDRCDYPDYADKAARALFPGEVDRAVLLCVTGIGMALTADKIPGVRAAAIQSLEFVELFRAIPNVDAGLAATIFHFGEVEIKDLKMALRDNGINVRL